MRNEVGDIMRRLDIAKEALTFLRDLQAKQYRQVEQKVFSLLADPEPHDSKKLVGYDFLRVDVGEYRIVYEFDSKTVFILLIGKRNDDEVYRKLTRR